MLEFAEVRAEVMRPGQIRQRRKKVDVAFLPIGTLEWHGIHGPIGTDGMIPHHICCVAALEKLDGGGVVFPPLVYGTPRDSFHMDKRDGVLPLAASAYDTTDQQVRGNWAHGGADIQEQWLTYQRLLRMTLEQIAGFGFRSIYICTGHAPLCHFVRPVAIAFSRASAMTGLPVTVDWGNGLEQAGVPLDHAGKGETSLMMAICSASVDLSEIERSPQYKGIGAGTDALVATAGQGRNWIEASAAVVGREAKWLFENYPLLPDRHKHRR
jgi:creatinine amidohydrolase